MNKLIEQAKEIQGGVHSTKVRSTKDEIELAVAWAKGEIALKTVRKILDTNGYSGGSFSYVFLAKALREYVLTQK